MDTSLAAVDASFVGEAGDDNLWYVSGAGDVNGDGYDDILTGAQHNDEGGAAAGRNRQEQVATNEHEWTRSTGIVTLGYASPGILSPKRSSGKPESGGWMNSVSKSKD
ncbi:MAG: FG-GAP repeat protein [Candidatus Coatesbacteria bacterium]|nr:FG-GAP repeat protein [Candidatus Coatesbacteria bacterium]